VGDDLLRLGPVLLIGGVGFLLLIWEALPKGLLPAPRGNALLAFALAGPGAAALWAGALDNFAYFFTFLFAAVAAAVVLASRDYSGRFAGREAAYHALLLFATGGMMLLAASRDLILIFVALELTSISQYIMAALNRDARSGEAAVKYLLLGATASAVILYGMAYLYGMTGSTRLVAPAGESSVAAAVAAMDGRFEAGLVLAVVLLVAGLGFKLAAVPFQMWVPDVYEGSPPPVAAFLSVASKAAAFAVVLRIFFDGLPDESLSNDWSMAFAVVAALSMSVGNVLALVQSNVRRLLGYSSIAHAGYVMVGVAAVSAADGGASLGASGVLFFLATYAFTNLAAFIAVVAVSDRLGSDEIGAYAGLARRSPLLAAGLGIGLVSLTGIPPTAGFIAKVYVFNAAVESDLVWLVVIAVVNSVVSAFYYLRVAGMMFIGEPSSREALRPSYALVAALGVAVAGVLFFGIVPSPLLDLARDAASVFSGSASLFTTR
jgi:NADH-quinone oxidoreductase subunit N